MPKRKKRELQHLRQESSRRRSYQLGNTNPSDIYKPGFPMNIFGNVKLFAIIGVFAAISMVGVAVLSNRANSTANDASYAIPVPCRVRQTRQPRGSPR